MLLDRVLGLLSPHYCKGCGRAGSGLCEGCLLDITESPYGRCLGCGTVMMDGNICRTCRTKLPFDRAYVVGERRGTLKRLVGDFKFNSERGQARVIIRLLDAVLPILPDDTVIVPVPTIAPHVRQRGFGHTELVARLLAKQRHLRCDSHLLLRATNTVQHGLKAAERRKQAAKAFTVNQHRRFPAEILLLDDIYTTGATVIAAAKLLKKAGVQTINLAIVARQLK
ncbi:amidophosphoribosyltransferase [Alphaproteobacteria bacterium]|nr:amidophosphoribosyltransferase [Alphaproteobacteria bacterium]